MAVEKMALSVKELSETLGISLSQAYSLTRRDGFPTVRVSPNRIIIPVHSLKAWLDNERKEGGI